MSHTHLQVQTKKGVESFRRCGKTFGVTVTLLALAALSESDLETLEKEPMLRTSRVTPSDPPSTDETSGEDGDPNGENDELVARPKTKRGRRAKSTDETSGEDGDPNGQSA